MPPNDIKAVGEIYINLVIFYFWYVLNSTETFH